VSCVVRCLGARAGRRVADSYVPQYDGSYVSESGRGAPPAFSEMALRQRFWQREGWRAKSRLYSLAFLPPPVDGITGFMLLMPDDIFVSASFSNGLAYREGQRTR